MSSDDLAESPRLLAQRHSLARLEQRSNGEVPQLKPVSGSAEPADQHSNRLPLQLRTGIAALTGLDLSDVRVQRNSDKPAQLSALAYAQGDRIHLAPGQDAHLAHEAWHLVQQRQGRVQPTLQLAGAAINDEPALEREADVMGAQAWAQGQRAARPMAPPLQRVAASPVVQRIPDDDPVPLALRTALQNYPTQSDLGLFHIRPAALRQAGKLLSPLAQKATLSRREKQTLLDAIEEVQQWQATVNRATLTGKEATRYDDMQALALEVHAFVGTGAALVAAVHTQSATLEHARTVPDFIEHLRRQGLTMFNEESGKEQLNPEGVRRYSSVKASFEAQNQRRIELNPLGDEPDSHAGRVGKMIANSYPEYQSALRAPDDAIATKRKLLESSLIADSLATAAPEHVTRERFAHTFPGGLADPTQLVVGQIYVEQGFIFVGGERANDNGFKMEIELNKGFPVDARRYYGHGKDSEEKMQWLTLPGAQFRYEGKDGDGAKAIYRFTQISR